MIFGPRDCLETFIQNLVQTVAFVIIYELLLIFQIDLATFATLNDQDLKELGISTMGARKKMLLAITGKSFLTLP